MPKINTSKSYVTTSQNTVDKWTEIFKSVTPDKLQHILRSGFLLIMKLHDGSDAEIEGYSEILIAGKRPGPVLPTDIIKVTYSAWANLSKANQLSGNYQEEIKIEVPGGARRFPEKHEIHFWLNSPTQIDWSNSLLQFKVEEGLIE